LWQNPHNYFNSQSSQATQKNLDVSSPTEIYERPGSNGGATLKITKLNGNQIKFHLISASRPNSGEASGTITLTNNRGVYKGNGFQLLFNYDGKSFNVKQIGNGQFGGLGARADGLYSKTSDSTPNISH
jgi:hypothetical protein